MTNDLAQALAASLEATVEERCAAIRAEAEKVIQQFREVAQRIATGTLVRHEAPAPERLQMFQALQGTDDPRLSQTRLEEPEPMVREAKVRSL